MPRKRKTTTESEAEKQAAEQVALGQEQEPAPEEDSAEEVEVKEPEEGTPEPPEPEEVEEDPVDPHDPRVAGVDLSKDDSVSPRRRQGLSLAAFNQMQDAIDKLERAGFKGNGHFVELKASFNKLRFESEA